MATKKSKQISNPKIVRSRNLKNQSIKKGKNIRGPKSCSRGRRVVYPPSRIIGRTSKDLIENCSKGVSLKSTKIG